MTREIFTDVEEGDQSKNLHNEAGTFKPNCLTARLNSK